MSEISTFVETWDTLLKHFCSRDDLRPAMCKPNIVGDYVYATDAHSWLKVPFQPDFSAYGTHVKTPNFASVVATWKLLEQPIVISKKSIFDALSAFDKRPDWIECKQCEGSGIKECPCCGTELTCKNCDGDGGIDDYTVPEVYDNSPEGECAIEVLKNAVAPFQLGRLLRVLDFVKADEVLLLTNVALKGLVFKSADVEIAVMPLMSEGREYSKLVKLEI